MKPALLAMALLLAPPGPAGAEGAKPDVLLPGIADIPILAGSKGDITCGLGMGNLLKGSAECLIVSGKEADGLMNNYVRWFVQHGWTFVGGASIQYWLERPEAGGCLRINMSALADYSLPRGAPGAVLFDAEHLDTCSPAV